MRKLLILAALMTAVGAAAAKPRPVKHSGTSALQVTRGIAVKEPVSSKFSLVVAANPTTIQKNNLKAAATLYAAAMLEEAQLFAAADKVAELFQAGKLPVGGGAAGQRLASYLRKRPTRLSESERRRVYGHVLGGSQSGVLPNREFATLMVRFVNAVNEYDRQQSLATLQNKTVSAGSVRRAGHDLATNLSNRSYGAAIYAARSLSRHMAAANRVLADPAVLKAYGAANVWQVVERVAKKELGKAANTTRYRRQAESGAQIINWLADQNKALSTNSQVAAALAKTDLSRQTRRWLRVAGPAGKLTSTQTKPRLEVKALCFNNKRRLMPCKVVLKKPKLKKK